LPVVLSRGFPRLSRISKRRKWPKRGTVRTRPDFAFAGSRLPGLALAAAIQFTQYRIVFLVRCETRHIAIDTLGIPREEVDAKVPEPVWRDLDEFAAEKEG
jgi:hypothetical protein